MTNLDSKKIIDLLRYLYTCLSIARLKKIHILIIPVLFSQNLFSQQDKFEDSLLRSSKVVKTDTAKASIYYQLADHVGGRDFKKAISYIGQGMQLSKNSPFYQAIGYFYFGKIYRDNEDVKANESYDKALTLFARYSNAQSYSYQSRVWSGKASIAQRTNDNKRFIDLILTKAIPLAIKAGDSIRLAESFTNLALPFMNYGDYNKAIYYFNKSAEILRRNAPMNFRQMDNFVNLSRVYLHQKKPVLARANLDSAQMILKQDPRSLYAPYYYTIEGMYYIQLKNFVQAQESLDKGLAIAEELKSKYDIRSILYQKARLFELKQDFVSIRKILLKMYNEGYVDMDLDKKQLLRDLAYVEEKLGNIKAAYRWQTKYSDFADSFYTKKAKLQIAGLEAKYNYTQKEQELLAANKRSENQRVIMWISIGGSLTIVGLFLYLFRLRKIKSEQELQSLKQLQRIALTEALLSGEEKERTRMARDLHDGLGGMLAGIKINLTNIVQENTSAEMEMLIKQLDNSVTELRRIARNMMPEALLRSGLKIALTDLCLLASTESLKVYSSFLNIHQDLPRQTQIIVYRIVQELLTNVIKHSGANEAFVQCSQHENTFFITVEDNGRGFNSDNTDQFKGLGLENISSRVDFLKGKMDIRATPEKGTIINIELQIDEKR